MSLQPPRRINVPLKKQQTKVQEEPQDGEGRFAPSTSYSPEYTAGKIPYNLRAAYVAYLQAAQSGLVLKELVTFRMEQGEVRPEDSRLIVEAKEKVDEFVDRMARKLKMIK